jgi:hypothetical protein
MRAPTLPLALLPIMLTFASTVIGQMLFRQGMLEARVRSGQLGQAPAFLRRASVDWRVIVVLASAGLAAAPWVVALSRSFVGSACPLLGLSIALASVAMDRWAY